MNPEFYEDEVIEGFYVPSMLKKAWGVQMDVLKETDAICRRHDIPYFADWGTLLAAIRHSGYIPWDDDLDISMRRSDYERFLRYAETELPDGFKVMHFKNHPGHHFFVARIVGKPRICFEEEHLTRFHGFPYIAGLDLFVLDNVCKDRNKEKLKAKKAEYVITVADNIADGVTKGKEAEEQLAQCEIYTGRKIDRGLSGEDLRVRMYTLAEELFASVPDDESDALVQMMPFGMYGNELYIPKEYYRKTVRLPYMDTTISVPLCYDAVMRMKFGDYMQIHKAVSGHDYPFFAGQHEQLLETLDFEYPSYRACADDIVSDTKRDTGIKERSAIYLEEISELCGRLKDGQDEDAVRLQEISIKFGTYIESVYGEGYGPVRSLEEMCELAYKAYEKEDVLDGIFRVQEELRENVKHDITDRTDVVFMPFSAKYWKYMDRLYKSFENDGSINVHVVPIPYYYKAWDGMLSDEVFEPDSYPSDLKTESYKDINLKEMHPSKIVIQNPFDEWNSVWSVPPGFYSDVIKKYTDELIYVPFFVTDDFTKQEGRDYSNMDHYVCMPGVIRADRILLPSETIKQSYIEKIMEFTGSDDETVKNTLDGKIGVCPEFLPDDTKEKTDDEKKTVVYLCTISFLAEHGQKAIDKIRRTMEVFSQHKDSVKVIWITVCCRKELGLLDKKTAEGFQKAVDDFKKKGIGEYIEDLPPSKNSEYARKYDAYYGDPSSLALQFFYRKKPVMTENAEV